MIRFGKLVGIVAVLAIVCPLTGCRSSGADDEILIKPEPPTTVISITTEATSTQTTMTTTTATTALTATTTTVPADGTPVPMPIKDITDADVRISNPKVFPQFFEPSAEVKNTVAEALKNTEWSVYVHKYPDYEVKPSPYKDLGIINVRYGNEMIGLEIYEDSHVDIKRTGGPYSSFHISEEALALLSDAFYSNEEYGNKLYVFSGNTEINEDFWKSEITEPVQNRNTAPFGDISNAYICMTDTGYHPWVYVPTDIQKKLISDYFNSEEWVELPEDAEPKLPGNTSAPDLYINNNGKCFCLYVDVGYILYNDGQTTKKYNSKNAYFIATSVLHTMLLDMGRYRFIDTGSNFSPYGTDPWDNAKWDTVIPIIEGLED